MTSSILWAVILTAMPVQETTPSRLAVIRQAPDMSLTTQEGKTLKRDELKGKIRLVSFVFTTCTGTCPETTLRLARVQRELKTRGLTRGGRVRFLSVTLDPARDTTEALKNYMKRYDVDAAGWSFLTGTPAEVAEVIKAWGIWVKPLADGQLDHPSRVFLVDTQGRIREIYNLRFLKPAWVAEDIALLLEEAKQKK